MCAKSDVRVILKRNKLRSLLVPCFGGSVGPITLGEGNIVDGRDKIDTECLKLVEEVHRVLLLGVPFLPSSLCLYFICSLSGFVYLLGHWKDICNSELVVHTHSLCILSVSLLLV